jgi:hypothetical protein
MGERLGTQFLILYDFSRDTESSDREPELPGSNDGSGGGEGGGAQPPRPFHPGGGGGGVQSPRPFFLRRRRGGGGGGCGVTTSVGRVVHIIDACYMKKQIYFLSGSRKLVPDSFGAIK